MKFESIYKDRDKRIGLITSILCLFSAFLFLLFNTFEIADPPPEEVPLKMSLPISALTFKNLKVENSGNSGGGIASDKKKSPKTSTEAEKVITSKKENDTKVTSGESSTNPIPDPNKKTTTPVKKPNPFASGGDQGKQDTGGVGAGFGKDTGPEKGTSGIGKGKGESGGDFKRIRLNDPYIENIESDVNYKIQLKVKIDADGNIIDAQNTSKTTTTSQIIINKVISATMSQVKYNKKQGAGVEEAYIIINIRAK